MTFSVIIPSSRPATLGAAIDSIRRQTRADWELLVIGQAGDHGPRALVERVMRQDDRIRYLHRRERGACRARNTGIAAARGEIITMIDDDCEAREDWLETLAGCFRQHPEVGIIGGAVLALPPDQLTIAVCPKCEPDEFVYDPVASGRRAPRGWGWVSANLAMRAEVVGRVGLFDEYLGPGTDFGAADDTDYLLRAEAAGVTMMTTPRAVVAHTYGYRYGLRAVYRQQRGYARGNGALAAKLTLLGDRRGRDWLLYALREDTLGQIRSLRVHRLPASLLHLWFFLEGYRHCLYEYRANSALGTLIPVATRAPLAQFN